MFQNSWWIIVGLIVGARWRGSSCRGGTRMGWARHDRAWELPSFVGGFIGSLIWKAGKGNVFPPGGFLLSLVGAILLVFDPGEDETGVND